jgi:hypothetical protein
VPLSPAKRRVKREQAKRIETVLNPPKSRKRRCANCNALFPVTKPRANPPQRFCKDECRKQFAHFGCAFGPLKTKLEKIVRKMTAETVMVMGRRITEIELKLAKL